MTRLICTAAAAALLAAPALAQDAITITTAESDEYGTYLTSADGRPLYLFTADQKATEGQEPVIGCEAACLEIWPLVSVNEGEPTAGEGVSADMIGTTEHLAQTVVTYNGWRLYTFQKDEGADAPQGQDVESFGGEWYLVTPEGEKVGHE